MVPVRPESDLVHQTLADSGRLWRTVRRTLADSGRTTWASENYWSVLSYLQYRWSSDPPDKIRYHNFREHVVFKYPAHGVGPIKPKRPTQPPAGECMQTLYITDWPLSSVYLVCFRETSSLSTLCWTCWANSCEIRRWRCGGQITITR